MFRSNIRSRIQNFKRIGPILSLAQPSATPLWPVTGCHISHFLLRTAVLATYTADVSGCVTRHV